MERLPHLAGQLVRRQFAVIVTAGGFATAQAAKDATTTVPIVFGVSDDPGQKRPLDFFGPRPNNDKNDRSIDSYFMLT